MKKAIVKHKKIIIFLLALIVLSRVLLATHYISKKDPTGTWKLVLYKEIGDNPDHLWEGHLVYYGKNEPNKIITYSVIDANGEQFTDEEWTENEKMDFNTVGTEAKTCWYVYNLLAFSSPSRTNFCFLSGSWKPEKLQVKIKWTENGEEKQTTIEYQK